MCCRAFLVFMDRDFSRLSEEIVNYRLVVKNISLSSWWNYYFLCDRGRRVRGVSKGVLQEIRYSIILCNTL